MDYVGKLWRGEVTLWVTYWLFGVLVGTILRLLFMVGMSSSSGHEMRGLFMLFTLLNSAFMIFVAVAVWRSAGNYEGNKVWAVLAKIAVCLGTVQALLGISMVIGA